MSKFNKEDLFEAASIIEEEYEIDIYKDIIFSDELNAYFNYSVDPINDKITFSIEVDEGGAEFYINDYFNECLITFNDTARKYFKRLDMEPFDLIEDF